MGMRVWVSRDRCSFRAQCSVWDAELAKPVLVETVPFWQGDTGSVEPQTTGASRRPCSRGGVYRVRGSGLGAGGEVA